MRQPKWILNKKDLNLPKGVTLNAHTKWIAKAQDAKTKRGMVEWLEQLCITPNHIQCGLRRGCCPECIEEVQGE